MNEIVTSDPAPPGEGNAAPEETERRVGVRWAVVAAAVYLAGAIALTWPLVAHLPNSTPSTYQDSRHIVWLLSWDAHVLAHEPTHLFEAPNFWPEPDTLTYTDHIMGLGIFAAPVIWATGNPYLAHNLLFIGSIAFAGWAAFLLAFDITGSRRAALVGGAVFAFAPYWFGPIINLSHLQTIAVGWMPLAIYALRRWLRSGRLGPLVGLSAAFVMGTLTSWYECVLLLVGLVVFALFHLRMAREVRVRRLIAQGLVAAVAVGLVLAPFTLPYRRTQDRLPGYTRSLEDSRLFSARPSSFLAAPPTNVLYGGATAGARAQQTSLESDLFPGITTALLALLGLISAWRSQHRRALFALFGLCAVGVVLSFGGGSSGIRRYLPWSFLFEHVIFFRGLRAAARTHVLTLIGLSGLAAFGSRMVLGWLPRRSWLRNGCTVALVALVALEGAAVPISLGVPVRPDSVHRALATRVGAILELPTGFRIPGRVPPAWSRSRIYDVDYMLMNTADWLPLVNGFSSFEPPSYASFMEAMAKLPDRRSLALLRSEGVRTVVIHLDRLAGTPWVGIEQRLARVAGMRVIIRHDRTVVYDVSLP